MGAFFSSLFSRTSPEINSAKLIENNSPTITNCKPSLWELLFGGSRQNGGTTRKRQIKQQKKSHQ
jgi:hypothetical protein